MDPWKGWLDTRNSDVLSDRNANSTLTKFMKDFGVIPCFKRAYEITYRLQYNIKSSKVENNNASRK